MRLNKITIKNFRSIENIVLPIEEINGSYTFSLIGINESGKSSFLRAIALVDEGEVNYPQDFYDETTPIAISLEYTLNGREEKAIINDLLSKGFDKKLISEIDITKVLVCVGFEAKNNTERNNYEIVKFKKEIFPNYTLNGGVPAKKEGEEPQEDFNLEDYFRENYPKYFWKIAHTITFWESSPKYLISDEINLETFAADPKKTSIPLYNCFKLAGVRDISARINKIKTNPADIHNLQDELGDKVTAHIKDVWPGHPIKIKIQINNMMLSFLVEDEGVKYQTKTTKQRSDGFRQFISFLLTISAENNTDQLFNEILLLDEPETHLHPGAQENLKEDLIKTTMNNSNNILFYATHSNYMIDKNNINRCYRVEKIGNKTTSLEKIKKQKSSYAEVNYEVFNISTNDYHNELYGIVEDKHKAKLEALKKDRIWKNISTKKDEKVSLSKYIRHSIHHPENTTNKEVGPTELKSSIEILRKLV
jgi:predicted ATP-dependent endonuclease of OLD family